MARVIECKKVLTSLVSAKKEEYQVRFGGIQRCVCATIRDVTDLPLRCMKLATGIKF